LTCSRGRYSTTTHHKKGKDVRIITGSTYDNIENLSKPFMDQIVASYAGSRLGMQEIEGIMLLILKTRFGTQNC
jgi:phage terminase large subunit-like protein